MLPQLLVLSGLALLAYKAWGGKLLIPNATPAQRAETEKLRKPLAGERAGEVGGLADYIPVPPDAPLAPGDLVGVNASDISFMPAGMISMNDIPPLQWTSPFQVLLEVSAVTASGKILGQLWGKSADFFKPLATVPAAFGALDFILGSFPWSFSPQKVVFRVGRRVSYPGASS